MLDLSLSSEWTFLNEGGANIVFRYTGTNPQYVGYILRVSKRHRDKDYKCPNGLTKSLGFEQYMAPMRKVIISHSWLECLINDSRPYRLSHRLMVKATYSLEGYLQQDLHLTIPSSPGIKSFSFEIKPKWHGALAFLEAANIPLDPDSHHKHCRFCNHNYDNLNRDRQYCPSDLFSQDYQRIVKALHNLQKNPRNNFRVYQDGFYMLNTPVGDSTLDHLAKILFDDPFLSNLNSIIHSEWRAALDCCNNIDTLLRAVTLRDLSFIVQLFIHHDHISSYNIFVIDVEEKPLSKLALYQTELEELRSLVDKI